MGTRVLLHGKAVCACIPQQFTWVAQGPLNLCTHPSRWSHAIAGYLAILGGETLLRADTGYGYLLDLSGLDDTQRRVAQAGQQVEVHCWQSGPIAPWPPDPGETLHVSQLHPLQPSAPHLDDTTGSMGNSMGTASSWGPAARRLAQAQAPPAPLPPGLASPVEYYSEQHLSALRTNISAVFLLVSLCGAPPALTQTVSLRASGELHKPSSASPAVTGAFAPYVSCPRSIVSLAAHP